MFFGALSFNGDISKWNVSSVTDMDSMFLGATPFTQQLCGPAWVHSKASKIDMFTGSSGSISRTECGHRVTRRPVPERELVVNRVPTSTKCSKCGTFRKSGRVSCCAPGGAWFKNCGRAGNRNVDHMWSEGVAACRRKFKANAWYIRSHRAVIVVVLFALCL